MILRQVFPFLILLTLLSSCTTSRMKGLWEVDRVYTGSSEVTPQARWVRFDKKDKQESGNGWYKHSYGTWEVKKKMLTIENENGYKDEFDAFKVKFIKKGMIWSRQEGGHMVKVTLRKVKEIPRSNMDNLLGVWKFKTALVNGKDESKSYNPEGKRYMHVKWDKMFVHHFTPQGSVSGFYRADVHVDEIEFIYNTQDRDRVNWSYELKKNRLVMTSRNTKDEVILEFIRIHELPE